MIIVLYCIEMAMKSVYLLLFTLVTVGNGVSRQLVCSAMCRQLSDTASRLVEVLVEVNITAVDWLANFSNYGDDKIARELPIHKVGFQNSDTMFL